MKPVYSDLSVCTSAHEQVSLIINVSNVKLSLYVWTHTGHIRKQENKNYGGKVTENNYIITFISLILVCIVLGGRYTVKKEVFLQ